MWVGGDLLYALKLLPWAAFTLSGLLCSFIITVAVRFSLQIAPSFLRLGLLASE